MDKKILLKVRNLTRVFGSKKKRVVAVKNVSFDIYENEIISIVGESGSGKTTTARMMLNLLKPTEGTIEIEGEDISNFRGKKKREYWRKVQGIFQDPFASFNQFFTVRKVLDDSFKLFDVQPSKEEKDKRIRKVLEYVNMRYEEVAEKYPFELSGGQRQRIMIARIFLIEPKLLIADEPTSMIDAVLRSGILELLLSLREREKSSTVFITHDLGLAYYVSDRILIMHNGELVEQGSADDIITNPQHPYTKKLIQDVPTLHQEWAL